MKLEEIKQHWEQSAKDVLTGSKVTPTSRDPYLGELERQNVLDAIPPGSTCLEVGCGDAAHTVHYARRAGRVVGVDLAESLVAAARTRLQQAQIDNVELQACSVLDIAKRFEGRRFDCIVSQRCLINLPDWNYQREALKQLHSLLTDNGLLLLTEGFDENLDRVNEARAAVGLPAIKVVEYNRNFLIREFEPFVAPLFETVARRDYGMYLFLSRVFHPLAVAPNPPKHDSELNRAAMELAKAYPTPAMADYSYNLFYVLRKK